MMFIHTADEYLMQYTLWTVGNGFRFMRMSLVLPHSMSFQQVIRMAFVQCCLFNDNCVRIILGRMSLAYANNYK